MSTQTRYETRTHSHTKPHVQVHPHIQQNVEVQQQRALSDKDIAELQAEALASADRARKQELVDRERQELVDKERVKQETNRQIESDHEYIVREWAEYQSQEHDAPPKLLPLEKSQNLESFYCFVSRRSLRTLRPEAIDRFSQAIATECASAIEASEHVAKELRDGYWLRKFLSPLKYVRKARQLLERAKVSVSLPKLGAHARNAVGNMSRFLRRTWTDKLAKEKQTVLSIHKNSGTTVIHVGSGSHGSIFITIPQILEPPELTESILEELNVVIGRFCPSGNAVAVIDGDHQEINFQKVLRGRIVVRSIQDNCATLEKNLGSLMAAPPPSPDTTDVHLGVPATEAELSVVFDDGRPDWDLWERVHEKWRSAANNLTYTPAVESSAHRVVDSLASKKNVIIIIAHSDGATIHLPSPPPKGSKLTGKDIEARRDEISANRPIVYLFCCETAAISNMKSVSQLLLDNGVAAVIAPQTTIDAETSIRFFEALISSRGAAGNSLDNIEAAARLSKYKEMEVWIG